MNQETSTASVVAKSLLGGLVAAAVIYVAIQATNRPEEAPVEVAAPSSTIQPDNPREVELYYGSQRVDSVNDIEIRGEKTTEKAFRELYAVSGELRLEQARALRDKIASGGEEEDPEFMKSTGIAPQDHAATVKLIEEEGVVLR